VRAAKSLPQVAKDLDLTESALRNWVNQEDVDEGKSPAGRSRQPSGRSWSDCARRIASCRWSVTS
jgi:transposase-like protein